MTALGKIGPEAKDAVPVLVELLSLKRGDPWREQSLRGKAMVALGKMGPAAAEAIPELRVSAEKDTPEMRKLARETLKAISGGE